MRQRPYRLDPEFMEDPYSQIRQVLAPEYQSLGPEALEEALEEALGGLSLDELEGIWDRIQGAARSVGNVLQRAAPGMLSGAVQGATTGATLGPYGALVGGALGALGGGLQSYHASQRPHPAAPRPTAPAPQPRPAAPAPQPRPAAPTPQPHPPAGSPAAAQLLGLLFRPETLQALMALLLGARGVRQIPVANRQVPVAAFANLIGALANRAAAEYNAAVPGKVAEVPEYLLDDAGEFVCDPAVPEERAGVLLGLMAQQIATEMRGQPETRDREETDWYDRLEEEDEDEDDEYLLVEAYEEVVDDWAWDEDVEEEYL